MQALINYYQIFAPIGTRSETESGAIHKFVWSNGSKQFGTDVFINGDTPQEIIDEDVKMCVEKVIAHVKSNNLSGGDKLPMKKDDVKYSVLTQSIEE